MEGRNVTIWLALIAILLFLAFVFISAFSPMSYYGMMGPWMMGPWMGFGWMWMPLIAILFLALIGVGVYFLITGSKTQQDRALEIARERYARGEMTKEEFDRIKRDLA